MPTNDIFPYPDDGEQARPTFNLRWYSVEGSFKVLQQLFIIHSFGNGVLLENRLEWREVDIVYAPDYKPTSQDSPRPLSSE